jgi:hypothetical protein
MTDWFEALVGFEEDDYQSTRDKLEVRGDRLRSKVNGRSYRIGELETPSLAELRARIGDVRLSAGKLAVSLVIADVGALHRDAHNAHALFQVASQFNLLEMTGPDVYPEDGVTRYVHDRSQGPACAVAAGAATIYRNYFVPVDGPAGQTHDRQIDCLRDVGTALGNTNDGLWTMKNGYALCSVEGLAAVRRTLARLSAAETDALRGRLRVGLHWNVEVVSLAEHPLVSQAFCSALPVSYTGLASGAFEPFARLVLEAAYEATLSAALLNARRGASRTAFLTLLGGGAFGNETAWILDALGRALELFRRQDLDVRIVTRGSPDVELFELVQRFG